MVTVNVVSVRLYRSRDDFTQCDCTTKDTRQTRSRETINRHFNFSAFRVFVEKRKSHKHPTKHHITHPT